MMKQTDARPTSDGVWTLAATVTFLVLLSFGSYRWLAGALVAGALCAWLAHYKRRRILSWAGAGLCFGLGTLVVLAFMRRKPPIELMGREE